MRHQTHAARLHAPGGLHTLTELAHKVRCRQHTRRRSRCEPCYMASADTPTHTHTQREREREEAAAARKTQWFA